MAPYGERPFPRGRRRVATKRAGAAPARRPTPDEPDQPHHRWEDLLTDAPHDDPFVDRTPTIPPGVADWTGDAGDGTGDAGEAGDAGDGTGDHGEAGDAGDARDEPAVVVVATTPGASTPQVAPPLTAAPPAPTPSGRVQRVPRGTTPGAPAPPPVQPVSSPPAPALSPPAAETPAVSPSGRLDATSEFGRMFGRLLVRMGSVERRLDGFEERLQAGPASDGSPAPEPDPATAAQEAEREYDRQMLNWLGDRIEALTADMEEQRRQGEGVRQALDDAVSRAELLAPTVADLQREAAAASERALALEARLAQLESLPAVMERVATDQFHRLAAELPSAPVDIEAVYKELDSVAEVLAARDAAVSHGLNQVGSLETAVSGLSDDFVRLVDELAAGRAAEEEAQERLRALEQRLAVLESPEQQMERLYTALDRARGGAPGDAAPGEARTTGIRVADGAPPGQEAASSDDSGGEPPHRAIQALAADLDRIRRSLEVLADEALPAD